MISVIVPLHNLGSKGDYCLKRCLDSLLAQTYTDFEVLLMENGSTDDTVSVAQDYCNKDKRFKLHRLDTIGVSNARNKGIELAQGEYIAFIDGDDFITDNYFKIAVEYFNLDASISFVQFSFIQYNLKNGKTKPMVVYNTSDIISLNDTHYFSMAVNVSHKVIKSNIIKNNNIRFDNNLQNYEDFLFGNEVFFNSDKAAYSGDATYFYVQFRQGQSTKNNLDKMCYSAMEFNAKLENFYKKYNAYDKYKGFIEQNFVSLFLGSQFAMTWIRKLDAKNTINILKTNKDKILNFNIETSSILYWQKVWFKRFQTAVKMGGGIGGYLFIKLMRIYRNLFIQPFKIK